MKLKNIRQVRGRWQVRLMVKGRELCQTFDSLEVAKLYRKQIRATADLGKLPAPGRSNLLTVATAGEDFLEDCRLRLAENTHKGYAYRWRAFVLPELGELRLDELTTSRLEDFLSHRLAAGASKVAVDHDRVLLSSFCSWAVRRDLLEVSPAKRVRPLRYSRQTPKRALTPEEAREVAGALEGRSRLAFLIALYTGIRASELCRLRWSDVDLEAGVIEVLSLADRHTKTYRSRRVPIHAELRPALEAAPRKGVHVIPGRSGGQHRRDLRTVIREALARTTVAPFRWHDLRHTFATWMRRAGVPLEDVMALLGHSSFSSTLVYAHCDPRSLAEAMRKLAPGVVSDSPMK